MLSRKSNHQQPERQCTQRRVGLQARQHVLPVPAPARWLVTNWSVHSASARELISDLFRRQRADPALTRGEALRQVMMALLDGPGAVDGSAHRI
jgi:hypothetical protein